jgi:hypothetical protein
MENSDIYFAIGKLTGEVHSQRTEIAALRVDVRKLVEGDTLARGGKKMLYKVGAVCSTCGAGLVWAFEHALKALT